MAIIPATKMTEQRHVWEAVTGGDTGAPIYFGSGGAQVAVQAVGTFGAAVSMQGTIDETNWFPLLTGPGGEVVSFAAAGYAEISTAVLAVRPSAAAGVSSVDVYIRIIN